MGQDIRQGRWLQLRGKVKRAWGDLVGDELLASEGNADVAEGALRESYGIAKREAAREVTRGVDKIAELAKRTARALER